MCILQLAARAGGTPVYAADKLPWRAERAREMGAVAFCTTEADVVEKGRVGPGELFAVDTADGQLWRSEGIDNRLKARRPYEDWLTETIIRIRNNDEQEAEAAAQFLAEEPEVFRVRLR